MKNFFDRLFTWSNGLLLTYWIGIMAITSSTQEHPDSLVRMLYWIYPVSMLLARHVPGWRRVFALIGCLTLVLLGVWQPLDMEVIEESFIFAPLLLLMLFPGKWWPIPYAFLLLVPYFLGNQDGLEAIIEDGAELILITSFSTAMAFYQSRLYSRMVNYRKDSLTDYLTRLSNRLCFAEALQQPEKYALLLIDMDDFKRVNDLYGHRYGDLLLRHFAERLEKVCSPACCFRLGGDEFAVLMKGNDDNLLRQRAVLMAEELLRVNKEPYELLNRSLSMSISVGIALSSHESGNEQLSRHADLALYHAKEVGKNRFALYEQALDEDRAARDYLEQELALALSNHQLTLHYQPKVRLSDGAIVGVEALLRWQHPVLGNVSPMRFIPLAERNRQIIPIGRWVISEACRQGALWHRMGIGLRVAVNLSSVQFEYDNLIHQVSSALSATGMPADLLELEITESSMMEDVSQAIPTLEAFRKQGIHLAIDDFGVAYSSLNQLSSLPIDVLKIDKSFVDRCLVSSQDQMILRSICQLAANLHLRVVAEGVETTEQKDVLQSENCHYAQGYLFYKPLTAEEITKILLFIQETEGVSGLGD